MPVLISGTSNQPLAEKVGKLLGMPLHPVDIRRFSDGEIYVELETTVRGEEIFLLQSTSAGQDDSVNDHLMELILMISACRRASAQSITAVIPYYGYARSDRLSKKRTTIAAADVAKILVAMGVDRVVCVELHAGQIEGFFGGNVAVDDLDSTSLFVNRLPELLQHDFPTEQNASGIVVVSPDAGGVARAKRFRNKCEQLYKHNTKGWQPTGLAIIVKHRTKPNEVARMDLVGQVQGKVCVLVDDMCDTAGTLLKAAGMLKDNGAKAVYACIAHGVLSGPACDRLEKDSFLTKLCVLDTIGTVWKSRQRLPNKLQVVSSSPILARAINAIASHRSLSTAVELSDDELDKSSLLLLSSPTSTSSGTSKL